MTVAKNPPGRCPNYRGGPHSRTKGPKGDGFDSHHIPADDASDLGRDEGPAIQMDPADDAQLASTGRSAEAQAWRARQRQLIRQGKFRDAQQMDIDDIHAKFGNKYDKRHT